MSSIAVDIDSTHEINGITLEDYEVLLAQQDGRCAICEKPAGQNSKDGRTGKPRRLTVDHCHKTMKIRGLLCRQCNYSLGCWGDTIEGVMRAIRYLERSGGAHE